MRRSHGKEKILLIGTGGTIAAELGENGLEPELTGSQLLRYILDIDRICRVECEQLFSLDSTNIQPRHWARIVEAIRRCYWEFDGFVIAHGTDTMAYTAAALSYLIQGSPKPIVLTGAQKPIGFETTDSKQNLRNAFAVVASNMAGVALMKLVPGADCGIAAYLLERHDALIIESFGVCGLPSYKAGDYYVVKADLEHHHLDQFVCNKLLSEDCIWGEICYTLTE